MSINGGSLTNTKVHEYVHPAGTRDKSGHVMACKCHDPAAQTKHGLLTVPVCSGFYLTVMRMINVARGFAKSSTESDAAIRRLRSERVIGAENRQQDSSRSILG